MKLGKEDMVLIDFNSNHNPENLEADQSCYYQKHDGTQIVDVSICGK